jgi:hypothetical protein
MRVCATYPALVANWVLDLNFIQNGAIIESNEQSVADRTLIGGVVLFAEPLIFNAENLGAEFVNARISGSLIGAVNNISICLGRVN